MKLTDSDIRDGESARDYVRRIPLWRQAVLLSTAVFVFVAVVAFFALTFVTFRQLWEALPVWANLFIFVSCFFIALATAAMMELRDRRRHLR